MFELARIMGTCAHMIERSYGVLIEGAGAGIASRLDAFDSGRERAANEVWATSGPQQKGCCARVSLYDCKRTTGFEPATFGLGSRA